MEIHQIILGLFLILISARFFAELFAHIGIPPVLGEVFAGIVIGPSLLNLVQPNEIIKILAEIGIILLLFEVGMETDLDKLRREGIKSVLLALAGVVLPFVLGFAVGYYIFSLPLLVSLFIGGTLTATSIGITVRVLKDLKAEKSFLAQIVIGAAVLDDIVGVILLVILADFAFSGRVDIFHAVKATVLVLVFLVAAPLLASLLARLIYIYDAKYRRLPGFIPTVVISLILLFAYIAHIFGAPEIVGAFAAGVALSRSFFVPFAAFLKREEKERFFRDLEPQMKPLIYLFTPIFFVSVGLAMNLREIDYSSPLFWGLTAILFLVAFFGKAAGAYLIRGLSHIERLIVGIAMVPRGEVGLIFAELGRNAKIFANDIYSALVFVVILTTLLPPFLLKVLYKRYVQNSEGG